MSDIVPLYPNMITENTNLDWPNLLAGVVLALVSGAIVSLARGLYGFYVIARDLPYPIWGTWFSAEFDQKGGLPSGKHNLELSGRNTFLKIKIKRRFGKKVVIEALGPVDDSPQEVPTKWVVHGHIVKGDTMVGLWRSTVKHTSRHGTAIIKFIDHGRALGYWTGSGETGYPMYGYWIITRTKDDVVTMANTLLSLTQFTTLDINSFVIQYLQGVKQPRENKLNQHKNQTEGKIISE